MNQFFIFYYVVFLFLVTGCYFTPADSYHPPPNLYLDSYFTVTDLTVESAEEIFSLTTEIKQQITTSLLSISDPHLRVKTLVQQLFTDQYIESDFLYDNAANLVASEAFTTRTANCLSLTIMAFAIADHANLNTSFQQVLIPEYWTHQNGYSLLNGHVNLRIIGEKYDRHQTVFDITLDTIIDFDPFSPKEKFPAQAIDKQRIIAMFYNNKGADAFINQQFNQAYLYFKQATIVDDQYNAAWGNLGLLYRFLGFITEAEQVYRFALTLDSDNLNVWNNLAILYEHNQQYEQAENIKATIERKRAKNPYYHKLKGDEAYQQQSWSEAVKHYKRAIRLKNDEHEFYYLLAQSYLQKQRPRLALRQLQLAIKKVQDKQQKMLYQKYLSQLQHRF